MGLRGPERRGLDVGAAGPGGATGCATASARRWTRTTRLARPYDGTFEQDWEFIEGLGDLDACNGREERSVIDDRTYEYAYYLTHTYPFMPRCLMGEPAAFAGATREQSAPEMDNGRRARRLRRTDPQQHWDVP